MEFYIEYHENYDEPYFIKEKETGWFFPVQTEIQAKTLCDYLNELTNKKQNTLEEYFTEWEQNITELDNKAKQLIDIKETYNQLEQKILEETDFKELYGANNQKIRDNHVKNELKDIVDEKHDLKLRIEYLQRRIDFIKTLMNMQRTLIDTGYAAERDQ